MHREPRVTPLKHALCESGRQHTLGTEEINQLMAQGFAEQCLGQWWQHPEGAGGQENAIGNQGMNMRIKRDEIAECLHVEDEGGLATRLQGVEAGVPPEKSSILFQAAFRM